MDRSLVALPCAVVSMLLLTGCSIPTYDSAASTDIRTRQLLFAGPGPMVGSPVLEANNYASPEAPLAALAHESDETVVRAQHPLESRLQIYSADFQISTTDIDASADKLIDGVTALGGYLQSRSNASVTVRVPAPRFQTLVDQLDEFGTVVSQSIKTDDVTDQYRDVRLRLGVLDGTRQRLMALLERAANIDELLKLEEQLSKVTTEIESMKGNLKKLDSEISYSTIQVRFTQKSFTSRNQSSPFAWVNRLGPAQVLSEFSVLPESEKQSAFKWFRRKAPLEVPDGFVLVKSSRKELQAISPDDARLWYREFGVSNDANLDFWAKAIRTHLVEHQGCRMVDESDIHSTNTRKKHGAYQMLVEADSDRGPLLHLLTVSVGPTLWPGKSTVRVTEFTAPPELYEEYRGAVAVSSSFPITVQVAPQEANPMLVTTHP